MSESRLTALAAYRALAGPQQSLVRLVLIDGLKPLRACAVLGLTNPTRTWNSAKVQAVVTAYGNPDTTEDWIARLETVKTPIEPTRIYEPIPENAPEQKAGIPAPSIDHRPPIGQPSAGSQNSPQQNQALADGQKQPLSGQTDPDRCQICGLILCSCPRPVVLGGTDSGIDATDLFPGLTEPLDRFKGPSSLDHWRQQALAEQDEKAALIRLISSRSEPTF